MAKKPIPSIHVPIQTENGSMELAWYLYLKSTGEGGGGSTTVDWDDITNKPNFATVATSGSYNDLSNKPTIPIVNNSTITFTQGGVTKGTITLNQSSSETIAFESGGGTDLPDQTGHSGDFLTTNGLTVSWQTLSFPVISVNGQTGAVNLTAFDVGALPDSTVIPAAQVNSDWNASSGVAEILNKPTLGTMAAESANDYTKTSGLAAVATSGSYSDLSNKPTIPAAQVNSDWNANSGVAEILNKPTIPTVNDATITFTQGGVTKGTITTNQSSASTIALDAGGGATVPQSIDADVVGSLTISNSDVSGFGSLNYLALPGAFVLNDASSFEIKVAFTTYSNQYSDQYIFQSSSWNISLGLCLQCYLGKLKLWVGSGSSTQDITGATTLSGSTKYYVKINYDGTNYVLSLSTDDINYTTERTVTTSTLPYTNSLLFGKTIGTSVGAIIIHMDSCYIKKNGIIIWQGMDAPGLHQRAIGGHEVIDFQKPTALNNYTWYRKYADGWVEQGGIKSVTGYGQTSNATITLPVKMADTNFFGQAIILGNGENIGLAQEIAIISATQISLRINYGSTVTRTMSWEVKGMYVQS